MAKRRRNRTLQDDCAAAVAFLEYTKVRIGPVGLDQSTKDNPIYQEILAEKKAEKAVD